MKIIKLENQKNDSFFEAECFLHIGEAKEDKNYVAFDLRREMIRCIAVLIMILIKKREIKYFIVLMGRIIRGNVMKMKLRMMKN